MSDLSVEQIQNCRRKATELRERAAKLPESDLRQQLIEIAREWDALAAMIERRMLRQ
jgi:hypothetical protein